MLDFSYLFCPIHFLTVTYVFLFKGKLEGNSFGSRYQALQNLMKKNSKTW